VTLMRPALLQQYPEIIALLIAATGFFVAYLVSRGVISGLELLEKQLHRFVHASEGMFQTTASRNTLARLVYYVVLGFFLLLALRSLGFTVLGEWLDLIIVYIPHLLLGAVIILGGYLLGILARSLLSNLMAPDASQLLPQLTQYLVVIAAVVTGLGQMAIDVSFLATLTLVVLGTLLGSLSLAFALGSRDLVANMLARRELERFHVGDHLQVDDVHGQLVELTPTGVVLEAGGQLIHIPASRLTGSIVIQGDASAS